MEPATTLESVERAIARRSGAHGSARLAQIETHISTLFFAGDRVYKLKKPVRFPFLDFSTRALREAACRREVELNRRLAPDVYLGVEPVLGADGSPCDSLVVMRRMPEERRLSTLLGRARGDECLRRVARIVAAFHAKAETSPEIAATGTRDAVARNWEDNFDEMRSFAATILPADVFARVAKRARAYLAGRAPLFEARIAEGKVRDGHGDLLADDVFCLDDGPRILDCIEFSNRLRYGDVLADVAFLAMDLERLGHPEAAARFLAWYREFSGDTAPWTLAHHSIAYRALVRSKVACIRAEQGSEPAREEATRLLDLAARHLEVGRVRLVLVGGLPGTGKSTLARGIAGARGWSLLHSDEVRKDLAGLAHTTSARAPFGEGIYSPETTAATYRELLARARRLLAMGEPVVLDASWTDRRFRKEAAALAAETSVDLVELRCAIPHAVAATRLRRRGTDPSDATPAIAQTMALIADPWPTSVPIDTRVAPDKALAQAFLAIETGPYGPDPLESLAALVAR